MAPTPLKQLVETWLQQDQDPVTRQEIEDLRARNDEPELEKRMRPRIAFGTAGLRARMEAGFARMNNLTVAQASTGLAEYLLSSDAVPDAKQRGVVIGHDHRHNSATFADLAAGALVAKGIKVHWLERLVHTPLVPFAIKKLGAAAGVMITASHNPARDNGYKVWAGNACQIIPPTDAQIAAQIDKHLDAVVWNTQSRDSELRANSLAKIEDDYYQAVKDLVGPAPLSNIEPLVYTAMHGVGTPFLDKVVQRISGQTDTSRFLIPVQEQATPDPSFGTVKFPNPEEHGALDLAYRTADQHNLTSIIALDPDADRFSAAEKDPASATWHHFTGNQVGVLLASYILATAPAPSSSASAPQPQPLALLNTTVSTGMLRAMSRTHAFRAVETLTGFKWLGNVAADLQAAGHAVPFAFEEALGYMFPAVVHDKDGVAAAAVWLAARAHWAARGIAPLQQLRALYAAHGAFADANSYLLSPSAAVTSAAFAAIRRAGVPSHLGSRRIVAYRDLTTGVDTGAPDGKPTLPVDAGAQMITVELDEGTRVTVRGSGTEPKIKLYVESVAESVEGARVKAVGVRAELVRAWFDLETWGLTAPWV